MKGMNKDLVKKILIHFIYLAKNKFLNFVT